ncbi:hypothetical protein [Microvirga tunisiensis]|uniref:hypothetical protein n=1 Tax=Microvirga tunisiensis TaxID=2108360 RepID=UPI00128E8D29|nr:hypothetical protein [Microvirga tunisiensis]MPR05638.1 hypothetical protein [Microvirga tunisiensis]
MDKAIADAGGEAAARDMSNALLTIYGRLASEGLTTSRDGAVPVAKDGARDDICGCRFGPDGRAIHPELCEPIDRSGSEDLARSGIVRVITREQLGATRQCFKEGSPRCVMGRNLKYVGLRCCSDSDTEFRAMERDPHLVLLAPLPVADRLSRLQIGNVENPKQPWQACEVAVDQEHFAPPARLNGFIARAMLYAADRYKVQVEYPLGTLKRVSDQNPPEAWEMRRNELIAEISRSYRVVGPNRFITEAAKASGAIRPETVQGR